MTDAQRKALEEDYLGTKTLPPAGVVAGSAQVGGTSGLSDRSLSQAPINVNLTVENKTDAEIEVRSGGSGASPPVVTKKKK